DEREPFQPRGLPSIRAVHLRRALLLFGIVLGLAAIAASVSRPRDDSGERATSAPSAPPAAQTERTPTVSPGADSGGARADVVFGASGGRPTRRIPIHAASTVLVEVDEPGQVEIPDLGLSAPGNPLTPARFEIFASEPGTHEVLFVPATDDGSDEVGTLTIEPDEG
ncbi:MAG TPA: hypothetical protein VNC17_20035, partial [Thermoleophilaceae bacterium]|nr:hypothetical protein [Thermoleophilaceae bacterium]